MDLSNVLHKMAEMPMVDPAVLSANSLLASLPRADRELIARTSDQSDLVFGSSICEPGDVIRHVYFPTTGYISLITPASAAESIEVGMVGDDGVFGVTVLLDVKTSPLQGLVQGEGGAVRMTVSRFKAAVDASPALRRTLNRYLYVLTSQMAQTAACNRHHLLDERLARWLLMSADRAHSSTFRLTHTFLAHMLGVRRTGVTKAAGALQGRGLIHYRRGEVNILDRRGLQAAACPCYALFTKTYRKHLAPPRGKAAAAASESWSTMLSG